MKLYHVFKRTSLKPTRNNERLLGIPVFAVEALTYDFARAEIMNIVGAEFYETYFIEMVTRIPTKKDESHLYDILRRT